MLAELALHNKMTGLGAWSPFAAFQKPAPGHVSPPGEEAQEVASDASETASEKVHSTALGEPLQAHMVVQSLDRVCTACPHMQSIQSNTSRYAAQAVPAVPPPVHALMAAVGVPPAAAHAGKRRIILGFSVVATGRVPMGVGWKLPSLACGVVNDDYPRASRSSRCIAALQCTSMRLHRVLGISEGQPMPVLKKSHMHHAHRSCGSCGGQDPRLCGAPAAKVAEAHQHAQHKGGESDSMSCLSRNSSSLRELKLRLFVAHCRICSTGCRNATSCW